MRSQLRYTLLLASALVACGGIAGCSGEPENNAGKMETGKMSGPMDKMETGKMEPWTRWRRARCPGPWTRRIPARWPGPWTRWRKTRWRKARWSDLGRRPPDDRPPITAARSSGIRGKDRFMPRLERKHSLATRIFHWANVPILAVMIYSGLLIYWANDVYAIRLGGITLVRFFPDWLYESMHLGHRLAEGMAWHFAFMWLFAINGLLYVGYTFWSGEWRELVPNRQTLGEAWQVVLHDLRIRKQPLPRRKFNGAQRLAYTGVVAMGAGSLLTGLAIYKPVQVAWLTALPGRVSDGPARAFRADDRLCALLHRSTSPRSSARGGTISARWSSVSRSSERGSHPWNRRPKRSDRPRIMARARTAGSRMEWPSRPAPHRALAVPAAGREDVSLAVAIPVAVAPVDDLRPSITPDDAPGICMGWRGGPGRLRGLAVDHLAEPGGRPALAAPPRAGVRRAGGARALPVRAALARVPPHRGADAPLQRLDRARIRPRPGGLEAPGDRIGRRGCLPVVHARRDQGASPGSR